MNRIMRWREDLQRLGARKTTEVLALLAANAALVVALARSADASRASEWALAVLAVSPGLGLAARWFGVHPLQPARDDKPAWLDYQDRIANVGAWKAAGFVAALGVNLLAVTQLMEARHAVPRALLIALAFLPGLRLAMLRYGLFLSPETREAWLANSRMAQERSQ